MIYQPEPWMERGACRSIGGEVFFPEIGEDWHEARKVCTDRCPVTMQCLEFAMRVEQGTSLHARAGLWGGLSPKQRKDYEPAWLAGRIEAA